MPPCPAQNCEAFSIKTEKLEVTDASREKGRKSLEDFSPFSVGVINIPEGG